MNKQIGVWYGGCMVMDDVLRPDKSARKMALKRLDKIQKLKRAMREKRGIIKGLNCSPENKEALLALVREDLREMEQELAELRGKHHE